MSDTYKVREWRKRTKARMVAAFGDCCGICDYRKCQAALTFHHLNPKMKEFSFGSFLANPVKWEVIVREIRKCVCLCCRCHTEVHAGLLKISSKIKRFDESFSEGRRFKKDEQDDCPVCGKKKAKCRRSCSYACAGRLAWKVDWDSIDLKRLMKTMSFLQIGRKLGISDGAVRKRAVRLGLL